MCSGLCAPIHVHVRVYLDDGRAFTTQLYFDEEATQSVLELPPYNEARQTTRVTNVLAQVPRAQIVETKKTGDVHRRATINLTLA